MTEDNDAALDLEAIKTRLKYFDVHDAMDVRRLISEVVRLRAAHQAIWEALPVVWQPSDPHGVCFARIATILVAAKMPEAPHPSATD